MTTYTFRDGTEGMKLEHPIGWYLARLPKDDREVLGQAAAAFPLEYFCPNGKQEEFIRMTAESVNDSSIPVVLFTAANGVGKTYVSLNIVANIIYGAQNGWFDYDLYVNYPFPKLCWYITTRNAIENVIVKEIEKMFPRGSYKFDKRGKPYISAVHFNNGWEMVFFTQDQDVGQMESATVGLIVGDEPFTEDIWKALKSRRRMGCLTVLPMTPLDVEPFIIDEVDKFAREKRKGYYRLTATVYDACKKRGIRGHLDPDIIDEMVASYSEEERQARAHGEYMYFKERIYGTLDPEKHWVSQEDYPLQLTGGRNYHFVDPHDGRHCATIYVQIYPIVHSPEYLRLIQEGRARQQYRRIVFCETPQEVRVPFWEMKEDITHGEEIEIWIDLEDSLIEQVYGAKVHTRVLDRVFGWQTRNGNTIANTFLNEGRKRGRRFLFKPSYHSKGQGITEIAYGHNMVREALRDLEDGKPGLVIWKSCWHTWNGLNHYVRKRARNADINKAAGETEIIPKYKDFPDVVRFACCENPVFADIKPIEKKNNNVSKRPVRNMLDAMNRQM